MEKFHQIHKSFFVGYMPALIDQLEIQPVDPVIASHCDPTRRDAGQEAENGNFRHGIICLLSVTACDPAADGQTSCRVVTIAYQTAEGHGNCRRYDVYQRVLFHASAFFLL